MTGAIYLKGRGPGIRNCNKADCGSIWVSRLIFTLNCLEPDGSLKFFHPPKLGALFDSANFQIPGTDGSEFFKSTSTTFFPTLVNTRVFYFPHWLIPGFFIFIFWANFSSRSIGEDPEH